MMCHSIAAVKSTMGQGDFYLEYPELHELAASKNPVVKYMHDFLVKLTPEPPRQNYSRRFTLENLDIRGQVVRLTDVLPD